jgi:DNA-binding protein HU-beta
MNKRRKLDMNKTELVAKVAEVTGWTKKDSAVAVDGIVGAITSTLVTGEEVNITGFGKFSVAKRAERDGICGLTKEAYHSDAKLAPKFKAGKNLKDIVNGR